MPSILRVLRSAITGRRPTGRTPGELYVNEADNQLGVIAANSAARDLLSVRVHNTLATYVAGDTVVANGQLWQARGAVAAGAFNQAQWRPYTTNLIPGGVIAATGGTVTVPLDGRVYAVTPAADFTFAATDLPTAPDIGEAVVWVTNGATVYAHNVPATWLSGPLTVSADPDGLTEYLIRGNSQSIVITAIEPK